MTGALISGIGIGFAVAMPVGPIGVLCIKRALNHGRAAGLATGLGAASADASYGVVVAAGLSFSGLLLSHADALKLGGGLLIMLLGLLSLRQFLRPPSNAPATANMRGLVWAWFSTFLMTLSNPMTILAFVGMIAGLGAGNSSGAAPYLLVFGVFIGSAMWWLMLVQGVLMVKSGLPDRALRWLDLVSGLVLLIWGGWIAFGG